LDDICVHDNKKTVLKIDSCHKKSINYKKVIILVLLEIKRLVCYTLPDLIKLDMSTLPMKRVRKNDGK